MNEADLFSPLQDNYNSPVEPTETLTFTTYGSQNFDVQYWTGSAWATVSGGSITGNNKVWDKVSFASVTTSKIRVMVNGSLNTRSRIVELEAWANEANGGSTSSIHWLVTDQLGTPRMVIDQTGALANVKRHDYLPFGEEFSSVTGLRSSVVGYAVADNLRQKFTSKERDNETGHDFFEARYYASMQGRFTSPDPLGGHTEDPQTLNRYTYVRNNPQRFTDPTGLDFYLTCEGNTATCQGGRAGHTDKKGNFTATIISNDKNGGLVDQNGNTYATKITGQGVSFSGAGCDEFIQGVFLNGTKATTIQGSGDLAGFTFNFTESNMDVNITAKGTFTFNGTAQAAEKALEKSGYTSYFGDKFNVLHPSSDAYDAVDYRSPGAKDTGEGSGHFTVQEPVTYLRINRARMRWPVRGVVPSKGDVHFGEHNPYTGGFKKHFKEVVRSLW